jgi:hypothetical protein
MFRRRFTLRRRKCRVDVVKVNRAVERNKSNFRPRRKLARLGRCCLVFFVLVDLKVVAVECSKHTIAYALQKSSCACFGCGIEHEQIPHGHRLGRPVFLRYQEFASTECQLWPRRAIDTDSRRISGCKVFRSDLVRMTTQITGHLVSTVGEYHERVDVCPAPSTSGRSHISKVEHRHGLFAIRELRKRLQYQAKGEPGIIELLVASWYAVQCETSVLG